MTAPFRFLPITSQYTRGRECEQDHLVVEEMGAHFLVAELAGTTHSPCPYGGGARCEADRNLEGALDGAWAARAEVLLGKGGIEEAMHDRVRVAPDGAREVGVCMVRRGAQDETRRRRATEKKSVSRCSPLRPNIRMTKAHAFLSQNAHLIDASYEAVRLLGTGPKRFWAFLDIARGFAQLYPRYEWPITG